MGTIRFTKGHGTGNDFVLLSDPEGSISLTPGQVAAICDRHFGVGADGVLRAVRSDRMPEGADAAKAGAAWFMDYRNADGSIAEMCGNGIRVFVRYLLDTGLAELAPGETMLIGTRAGVREVRRDGEGFMADLGRWSPTGVDPLVRAKDLPVARPGLGIDVGNPHVVVALAGDDELDALDLAYAPLLDPAPEAGANVEFVVARDVEDGVGRIRMRVHERGSGETLSCGTGAVAAALATRIWAGAGAPDSWIVDVPGGSVRVGMTQRGDGEHVTLGGPADLVFDGTLEL